MTWESVEFTRHVVLWREGEKYMSTYVYIYIDIYTWMHICFCCNYCLYATLFCYTVACDGCAMLCSPML